MPAHHLPPHPPTPPDPTEIALRRAELAAVRQNPWLASLFMRRLGTVHARLAELRDWLASLPRRLRRGWTRRWALTLPTAALVMALASGAALAKTDATLTVDPGGSGCTLSAAITNANNDDQSGSASCAAGSGADTIQFAGANGTYSYTAALPYITSPITIQGNGNTTIQRTGGGAFSVLIVLGSSLALSNATISGGSASDGGGIYADASTLSLTSTTISGNSAADDGGGIFIRNSSMNMQDATVSGNSAGSEGGGIRSYRATVDLTRSTISGNSAARGGGIRAGFESTVNLTSATVSGNSAEYGGGIFAAALGGTVSLTNTTVSGNSAAYLGGGIFASDCLLSVIHATISGNTAGDSGSGIYVSAGEEVPTLVEIQSSIVALQAAGGADCAGIGQLDSLGYNIESATSCGFTATGDQQNVTAAQLALGPLALNAPGTTRTRALGTGSAALNQIPNGTNGCGTTITTDQRGVVRPQLTGCDVGAYELQPVAPTAAQVTHFAAAPDPTGRIHITWETASEVDVVAFRIERAPADPPSPQGPPGAPRPQAPWTAVGPLVPARGAAAGGARYTATDAPGVGSFAYRLVVVNADGPLQTQGPVGAVVRALRAFLPFASAR